MFCRLVPGFHRRTAGLPARQVYPSGSGYKLGRMLTCDIAVHLVVESGVTQNTPEALTCSRDWVIRNPRCGQNISLMRLSPAMRSQAANGDATIRGGSYDSGAYQIGEPLSTA